MSLVVVLTDVADRSNLIQPIIKDLTNKVNRLQFATNIPSGFVTCTFSLSMRKTEAYEWYERFLFFGINVFELESSVWEGRISTITITDEGIDLECEGYWANLADQTMYSWFDDNDMSKWRVPSVGSGGISDEITLSNLATEKLFIQTGKALLAFGLKRGQSYSIGDRGVVYYKLPKIGALSDRRLFEPMTIHAIQFKWDREPYSLPFDLNVWTADYPKGTWTERYSLNAATAPVGIETVNLEADGADVEAIAIGEEINTVVSNHPQDDGFWRATVTDLTIYADRDPLTTNKVTPSKIIKNLISGESNIDVTVHANQISSDLRDVQDSDFEIAPAVYEGQTLQDIITELTSFGVGITGNIVDNPNLESVISGWTDEGGTPATRDATEQYEGTYSAKVTTAGSVVNEGILIRDTADSRFAVDPNAWYAASAYIRSDPAKTVIVNLRWYTSGDVEISVDSSGGVFANTSWQRGNVTAKSPSNAAKVQIEVLRVIGISVHDLWVDAAMLEKADRLNPYLAGNLFPGIWAGNANESSTLRLYPANVGVWGRNRLHVKIRDQENVKWILPLREMASGGLQFQRSTLDFYSRMWGRYTEIFTGDSVYTDMVEAPLEQSLIFGERDKVIELGDVLQNFAESVTRITLDDARRLRQRTEVTINGTIMNVTGAREPLWRVRAGDVILIPDLTPFPFINSVRDPFSLIDNIRTFVIRATEYDYESNELSLVPDLTPDSLEQILATLTSTPSFAAGKNVATRAGSPRGPGGAGAFGGNI